MLILVKISGHSMEPTLRPGSIVLVEKLTYFFRKPRLGDIVVFRSPKNPGQYLCKRVTAFDPDSQAYELRGDNPGDSLDSRKFGTVNRSQILGRAIIVSRLGRKLRPPRP